MYKIFLNHVQSKSQCQYLRKCQPMVDTMLVGMCGLTLDFHCLLALDIGGDYLPNP